VGRELSILSSMGAKRATAAAALYKGGEREESFWEACTAAVGVFLRLLSTFR